VTRAVTSRTITAALLAVVAAPLACLRTLPEPTSCGGGAIYGYCDPEPSPSPPPTQTAGPNVPPLPGASCAMLSNACVTSQRGVCRCGSTSECPRTSDSCNPPPDCPAAVREASPGARCLEARTSLGATNQPSPTPCVCGCASCALVCDGKGPIVGGGETLHVDLDGVPSSGQLGLLVRARGVGRFTVAIGIGGGAIIPVIANLADPKNSGFDGPGKVFGDVFPRSALGATPGSSGSAAGPRAHTWSDDRQRPSFVELTVADGAEMELDCVVPFLGASE